ncbi:MAG: dimethyl sulfoxide reductase anchor subunit [Rhodobacteraceae bacterium]|nr:dimethyl sulfoxide reductase anchor subunit [Paracoccaceae bacterium]
MHPAPSVILFTSLSGAGFGLLFWLDAGLAQPQGMTALAEFAIGYGLATAGLIASTFHLGNPRRAWRAFSQWRTSWLSREGWAALAALAASAPVALSAGFGPPVQSFMGGTLGLVAALLALLTLLSTAMIYAQLKTVPRWHHWTTPLTFFAFAAASGAILSGAGAAPALCLALGAVIVLAFWQGDRAFARRGTTLGEATGLKGYIRPFAPAHTARNYVMDEMIHRVGRKHAQKLRLMALAGASLLPAALLLILPQGPVAQVPAFACHLLGTVTQRWLFFAEADHVVRSYYTG